MKHLKFIGLAAIAATALMALAAGSASADVPCKTAPNKSGECSTTTPDPGSYGVGTTFKATSTNSTLAVSAFGITGVTCSDSTIVVKTTSGGSQTSGEPVTGEVPKEGLTWSGCETEGFIHTACTVSANSVSYLGTIKALNDIGTGSLSISSATSTTVICSGVGMHCTYTSAANGVNLGVTGGNPASFVATNQTLSATGSGCPTTGTWNATYTLKEPTAMWPATKMA